MTRKLVLLLAVGLPLLIGHARLLDGLARREAHRLCLSNQKTLSGALEARYLDKGLKPAPTPEPLSLELQRALQSAGYISQPFGCPAGGPDSYLLVPADYGVFCFQHGTVPMSGAGSARQQLQKLGIQDAALSSRALDRRPPLARPDSFWWMLGLMVVLAALTALAGRAFFASDAAAWAAGYVLAAGILPLLTSEPNYAAFEACVVWMAVLLAALPALALLGLLLGLAVRALGALAPSVRSKPAGGS